ncbi:MAG: DUF547 domain-containing protein [Brevundimonas sp.]|uniref:DUF547 domain-containing protein n=1 Tax=Brevundimonas sp. TaxID=1871086 RepID=UPI002734C628|nr:DUF547 domain-containing protein [Brevundimonas sp.]MBX9614938.1 DUF547 domain-containing protein [Caulobacteraceae bacterium]MDP3406226.1 DUF547 domain-containing protein [Brevundimonas sp.]
MTPPSRRTVVLAAVAGLVAGPAVARQVRGFTVDRSGTGTADHAAFDSLLALRARNSRDGVVRVDYAGWASSGADRRALAAYIAGLSRLDPLRLTRPEQFAFWANLYNAVTLELVLEAWPVRSIRALRSGLSPGPWRRTLASVSGVDLSLDDIEHGILRTGWAEPRVHYAVNCASIGCPNLPLRALRGATLGPVLDAAARAYVNHPRGVRIEDDRLVVSSIYKWYAADFGGSDARVIAHLARFADEPLKARLEGATRIHRDVYDWSINAIPGS